MPTFYRFSGVNGRPSFGFGGVPPEDAVEITESEFQAATRPTLPELPLAADLAAYAADRRYRFETAGITVEGVPVATDRASQGLIAGAHALAQADPTATIRFKSTAGFVELTADQVSAIALAVGRHVQAAFAREADAVAGIEGGLLTTRAEIDAIFA